MSSVDASLPTLTDPVCGADVGLTSPFSCVRAGAIFCFCSQACRARFLADPVRFVVIARPEESKPVATEAHATDSDSAGEMVPSHYCSDATPIVPQVEPPFPYEGTVEPERPLIASTISAVSRVDLQQTPRDVKGAVAQPDGQMTVSRSVEDAAAVVQRWTAPRGFLAAIRLHFLAWQERRHAERTSKELLALFRRVQLEHPMLSPVEQYRKLIAMRCDCDDAQAQLVLEGAIESFAEWPVRRKVTLCDVVHYLSISEFLASHKGEHWMHSDIQHLVSARIPTEFCVEQKIATMAFRD